MVCPRGNSLLTHITTPIYSPDAEEHRRTLMDDDGKTYWSLVGRYSYSSQSCDFKTDIQVFLIV